MIESLFLPLIASVSLTAAQTADEPAPATPAPQATNATLSAEDRAALRCSAAFAIVTQRAGQDGVLQTELRQRGREFFVVTLASQMEKHKLDRAAIEREVRAEAQKLSQSGEADKIMPACLLMLQAAGL